MSAPGRTPRGAAGAALVSVPILLGSFLLLAGIGLFVAIGVGFEPSGATVRYTFQSACMAEARPQVLARLADLGLPTVPFGAGLDLQVQLPGVESDELEHIPRVLTRPGRLDVKVDGQPFPVDIRNAGFQLSVTSGLAVTLVTLGQSLPESGVEVLVDGAAVPVESVNGGELQLSTSEGDPRAAIREATERAVALRYPLPCPVVLSGTPREVTP